MSEKLSVFCNGAYLDEPGKFPRQIGRLNEISNASRKMGVETKFEPICFIKGSVDQIHAELARQIRERLSSVLDGKCAFFGGDGFIGAMINAWGNVRDGLLAEDGLTAQRMNKPVLAAMGGSYNLFARRLNSASLEAVSDFADGIHPNVVSVKRRVLELMSLEGLGAGRSQETTPVIKQSYPFTFFAGTGTDSLMLYRQENQSRATHWLRNSMRTILDSLTDIWVNNGKFDLNTVVTIPYFGFMNFPKSMDSLNEDSFFRLRSHCSNALETSAALISSHLANSNRVTSALYFYGNNRKVYREIVGSIDKEWVQRNHKRGVCLYTDGYPQIFPLDKAQHGALLSVYTKEGPGVNMASYNMDDYYNRESVEHAHTDWRKLERSASVV